MGSRVCVGGLTRDAIQNVRLLPATGDHSHPAEAPYSIGDIWELTLRRPDEVVPPHIEDMLVEGARRLGVQTRLHDWLSRSVVPWVGDATILFDGALRASSGGSAYVTGYRLPTCSVGFWRPGVDLELDDSEGLRYFAPFGDRTIRIAYVGVSDAVRVIPAGFLVRVSLARWFSPGNDGFEACWLQLSGWYAP
jgi:hypothetical protein